MNNKGFIFIESIITTVILLTSILLVYSTFSSVITSERKRLYYDDPSAVYKTVALKDFFNESVNEDKLNAKIKENDYYINLFSIGSDIYDNQNAMIEARQVYNFTYLGYLTINDLYLLKDCINGVDNSDKCKRTLDYLRGNDCEELIKYIKTANVNVEEKYMKYSDAPTHILIGMYFQSKDGDTQFIHGYDDCIKSKVESLYNGTIDDYYKNEDISYSMKCENAYYFGWVFLKSDQGEASSESIGSRKHVGGGN